jgi:hypothetical protein
MHYVADTPSYGADATPLIAAGAWPFVARGERLQGRVARVDAAIAVYAARKRVEVAMLGAAQPGSPLRALFAASRLYDARVWRSVVAPS